MKKNNTHLLITLLAAALILGGCIKIGPPAPVPTSKWISGIVKYEPAPGQFVNTAIGIRQAADAIIGRPGAVTLGGYGGYIIFGFDSWVQNIPGPDLCILGNAFEGSSEPGGVVAIVDKNSDGIFTADEMYHLGGSEYDKAREMTITYKRPADMSKAVDVAWTNSLGEAGMIKAQPQYHTQSYFPNWITTDLKLTGRQVPFTPIFENEKWVLPALANGYADNYSADYAEMVGGDIDTKNSNKFDLDNAIDHKGNRVKLDKVTYIMVYTCVNAEGGAIGEVSTEVCGAINLSANK